MTILLPGPRPMCGTFYEPELGSFRIPPASDNDMKDASEIDDYKETDGR